MQLTYSVPYKCYNCFWENYLEIEKEKIKPKKTECPNCKCKTAIPKTEYENENWIKFKPTNYPLVFPPQIHIVTPEPEKFKKDPYPYRIDYEDKTSKLTH